MKVTPFSEYPAKGRATGGVRCHRFLKGEDDARLRLGGHRRPRWRPPTAAPRSTCPSRSDRRDGSGQPGSQPIAACAGPVSASLPADAGDGVAG